MKSIKLIILTLTVLLFSCEVDPARARRIEVSGEVVTQSIQPEPFTSILIAGPMRVVLAQSGENSIQVETYESLMDIFSFTVIDDMLVLYIPDTSSYVKIGDKDPELERILSNVLPSGSRIKWPHNKKVLDVRISYSDLQKIRIIGECEMKTDGAIRSEKLEMDIAGILSFKGEVIVDELEVQIAGAANLDLWGRARNFNVECAGAGTIKAYEFIADHVDIGVAGFCNANVYSRESIRGEIAGVGNIRYKGNPSSIDFEKAGFGSIKQVESENIDI
jgi:hypothetical protein